VSRVLRVICGFKKEEAKGQNVSVQDMVAKGVGGRGILHLLITSALDGGD
jgi:hypothetical protein